MNRFQPSRPRVVLTYGRFDLFHQGHVQFLRQAFLRGSELVVGCATDAHAVAQGTPCQMPFEQRREILEACRYVSRVIPLTDLGQKRTDIVNYNASALILSTTYAGKYDDMQDIAQVVYLEPEFENEVSEIQPDLEKFSVAI